MRGLFTLYDFAKRIARSADATTAPAAAARRATVAKVAQVAETVVMTLAMGVEARRRRPKRGDVRRRNVGWQCGDGGGKPTGEGTTE